MIGKQVSHYNILEKLGEGGMSQNQPGALCVPLYGFRFAGGGILGSGTSGCDFDPEGIRGAEAPAACGVGKRKREVSI